MFLGADEIVAYIVKHVANGVAQESEGHDGDDGDEGQDQAVFHHALSLIPVEQAMNALLGGNQKLNHGEPPPGWMEKSLYVQSSL